MKKYEYGILKELVTPMPYVYKNELCDNNIFTFDIETSSAWLNEDLELLSFKEIKKLCNNNSKQIKKYVKKCTPYAVCYIWQFGINDTVLYGRELNDFKILLDELLEVVESPTIWIHNLAYETGFLFNIVEVEYMFARKSHKPMYFTTKDGIKFRCSYMLTRLSLASWAESLNIEGIEKKEGQLDYSVIRTPNTKLTDLELEYCEFDIVCMYYGLMDYLNKYDNVENIPITQTGIVRRVVRDMFKYDYGYHKKMTNLLPKDEKEYNFLKQTFSGGYTHANYIHARTTIKNVKSKDIASSYPFVMISEKFPSSTWTYVPAYAINDYFNDSYSLIMDVTFYDIETTGFMTYISISKCIELVMSQNDKIDNGRIVSARKVRLRITNVDYDIITRAYKIRKIKYNETYASVNRYLDTRFIRYVLELYNNKTALKGVDEKEDIYLQSKQYINAMYGMMVSDICNDNYSVIDDKWVLNKNTVEATLSELREKPYKNFLAYQHGVFITAYARRNLWDIILQMDKDVIYVDTDSVKYIGNHEKLFTEYNNKAIKKLEVVLTQLDIPIQLAKPKDIKGVERPIGMYETEKPYCEFRTLGAKRYAFKHKQDDNIGITVSGVSKKKGWQALNTLDEFDNEFEFSNEYSGKLIFTYLTNMLPVIWNKGKEDEYISHYKYGICSLPTTYILSMDDDYLAIIEDVIEDYF